MKSWKNSAVVVTGEGSENALAGFGGGISEYGTLTLSESTVSDNSAVLGGGIYNGNGFGSNTVTLSAQTQQVQVISSLGTGSPITFTVTPVRPSA